MKNSIAESYSSTTMVTRSTRTPMSVGGCPRSRQLHHLRLRQWQVGRLIAVLTDKAQLAGITVHLVDERGTSSTCPACRRRIGKPRGRVLTCPHCHTTGHRDLVAAATIATRTPGGAPTTDTGSPASPVLPQVVTHRRAGRHLPGAGRSRRDPRRPHPGDPCRGRLASGGPPHHHGGESLDRTSGEDPQHHQAGERLWTPH
jgi:hypothetical protein